METTVKVKDMSPGHWYQFQVSAVSVNGTKGVSPPTEPFMLSRGMFSKSFNITISNYCVIFYLDYYRYIHHYVSNNFVTG